MEIEREREMIRPVTCTLSLSLYLSLSLISHLSCSSSIPQFYINKATSIVRHTLNPIPSTLFLPRPFSFSLPFQRKMAAFPYQSHVPFPLDFAYLPSVSPFELPSPSALQQGGDLATASSCLPSYYTHFDAIGDVFPAEISTVNAGTSSISAVTATTPMPDSSSSPESGTLPSADNMITSSSSSAQPSETAPKTQCSLQKKRKDRQRRNSASAQSKDSEAGRSRKLKKRSGAMKEAEEKAAPQQPPTGYVHVRARRGEATDSHSLAERVRREKIREKMKMLQDLVPGCDKVVGKALLLEEIINYVQSLQNQVEFLSMKLASIDPMLYGFGLHLDDYIIQPEKLDNMSPELPNVQRASHIQPTAFADATNSYSFPFLLHEEGPGSFPQDNASNFVMQVGDRRQSFLNQVEFNNMSCQ